MTTRFNFEMGEAAAKELGYGDFKLSHYTPGNHAEKYEAMLLEGIEEAKKKYQHYIRSKMMHTALNTLMPGWQILEFEDSVDEVPYGSFVSNSKFEWIAYLVSKGVPNKKATILVENAWKD